MNTTIQTTNNTLSTMSSDFLVARIELYKSGKQSGQIDIARGQRMLEHGEELLQEAMRLLQELLDETEYRMVEDMKTKEEYADNDRENLSYYTDEQLTELIDFWTKNKTSYDAYITKGLTLIKQGETEVQISQDAIKETRKEQSARSAESTINR